MSAHVSHDLAEWRRRAALGDDPFWPWAVSMVESAQAEALGQVEEAHRTVALTGTLDGSDTPASPSAVRAQENALKSAAGSDLYTDPAKTAQHGAAGGGAGVTINTILMYLGQGAPPGGDAATPRGLGALVDGAWGGGQGGGAGAEAPAVPGTVPYDLEGAMDDAPKRSPARVSFKPPAPPAR